MIANCGHDERGKYNGGKDGDQTGTEYCVRTWYNRPWGYVLRYPNKKVGAKIASIAKAAALNNKIGYDQNERGTFYTQLIKADYKPENIKKSCEADCSSSTSACVIAAGKRLGIAKLCKVNPYNTTRTILNDLRKAGFKIYRSSKYLTSDKYLLPGDILLSVGHHVAINLTTGVNMK